MFTPFQCKLVQIDADRWEPYGTREGTRRNKLGTTVGTKMLGGFSGRRRTGSSEMEIAIAACNNVSNRFASVRRSRENLSEPPFDDRAVCPDLPCVTDPVDRGSTGRTA
jgi:hypothetical protein